MNCPSKSVGVKCVGIQTIMKKAVILVNFIRSKAMIHIKLQNILSICTVMGYLLLIY